MKSRLLIFLLVPLLGAAQGKMTLTGKITGLTEGSSVLLVDVNKPADTLAIANVKNGVFVLKAQLKEPLMAGINFGNNRVVTAFLDNTAVKASGSIEDVKNIKFTGSSTQKDFVEFQRIFNPPFDKLMKISQQMQQTGQSDSLMNASVLLQNSIQLSIDEFIGKHKSSVVSAFLIAATMQLKDDILLTEKRFNQLKPVALKNIYGNYIMQAIATTKLNAVGTTALDFTQPDTLGNPVSLSSFRGKYVLVDFWASWCGPCRQENPNVVVNYNKFKEKNFTVLGVSLDRPGQKDKWLQAIHNDNLAWTHVSDLKFWNNAVAQQYKIESIPQNFLIGPDGKVVAKNLRGPALQDKLCEVLGCN